MFTLALMIGMTAQTGINPCNRPLPAELPVYASMLTNGKPVRFLQDEACRIPVNRECSGGDVVCLGESLAPDGCYSLRSGQSFAVQYGRVIQGGTYMQGENEGEDGLHYRRTDGEYEIRADSCRFLPQLHDPLKGRLQR